MKQILLLSIFSLFFSCTKVSQLETKKSSSEQLSQLVTLEEGGVDLSDATSLSSYLSSILEEVTVGSGIYQAKQDAILVPGIYFYKSAEEVKYIKINDQDAVSSNVQVTMPSGLSQWVQIPEVLNYKEDANYTDRIHGQFLKILAEDTLLTLSSGEEDLVVTVVREDPVGILIGDAHEVTPASLLQFIYYSADGESDTTVASGFNIEEDPEAVLNSESSSGFFGQLSTGEPVAFRAIFNKEDHSIQRITNPNNFLSDIQSAISEGDTNSVFYMEIRCANNEFGAPAFSQDESSIELMTNLQSLDYQGLFPSWVKMIYISTINEDGSVNNIVKREYLDLYETQEGVISFEE